MTRLHTIHGYAKANLLMVIGDPGFLLELCVQVLNVQVPFLFKLAVDSLTTASGNAAALASSSSGMALFATPVAVLVGYGIARSGAAAFNGIYVLVLSTL